MIEVYFDVYDFEGHFFGWVEGRVFGVVVPDVGVLVDFGSIHLSGDLQKFSKLRVRNIRPSEFDASVMRCELADLTLGSRDLAEKFADRISKSSSLKFLKFD